jgi:hypothetical protein
MIVSIRSSFSAIANFPPLSRPAAARLFPPAVAPSPPAPRSALRVRPTSEASAFFPKSADDPDEIRPIKNPPAATTTSPPVTTAGLAFMGFKK